MTIGTLVVGPVMATHHPAKFGGHRRCVSEGIMFLVTEREDSKCSLFNPENLNITFANKIKSEIATRNKRRRNTGKDLLMKVHVH